MLMIIALEHLRRQFLSKDTTPKPMRRTTISSHREGLPAAQIPIEIPVGTRYQLLRALRAMAGGELMVVEYRIPQLSRQYLEDDDKRAEWFRSLRSTESWNSRTTGDRPRFPDLHPELPSKPHRQNDGAFCRQRFQPGRYGLSFSQSSAASTESTQQQGTDHGLPLAPPKPLLSNGGAFLSPE